MGAAVVTTASALVCAHGGAGAVVVGDVRVRVCGAPAVLVGDPVVVAGCPARTPPDGPGPCLSGVFLTGAGRVRSRGRSLAIFSGASTASPAGPPLIVASAQSRVSAL